MPRSTMTVQQVAQALHVSQREVVRMVEQRILPAMRVKGHWQFRAAEIWNWIEQNIHSLPHRRSRDRHPAASSDLLLSPILDTSHVVLDATPKTKASLLRELAALAARIDPLIDEADLAEQLTLREQTSPTALERGVAVPHPQRPLYIDGPVLAIMRTAGGLAFGERGGGLTDLYFLICCPDHLSHLLYLGRLCRLLLEDQLLSGLREADDAESFVSLLIHAEQQLCDASDSAV